MTEYQFREHLRYVDSLVDVDFNPEGFPYCIRVRPSHPRYRERLIVAAYWNRPMGVAVSVVKEVDDWEACTIKVNTVRTKAKPVKMWVRLAKWFKRVGYTLVH